MKSDPTAEIDSRFSDPEADPTPWSDALHVLEHAELYWLTTVRTDGRPHVTPLIAVARTSPLVLRPQHPSLPGTSAARRYGPGGRRTRSARR